jgi:hypothetical protein
MAYDGSIRIDTSIDGKGFNTGVDKLIGSLKPLAAAIGVTFGLGALVAFGKTAVDAAAEIEGAFIGLQSIVEGNGRSFAGAKAFIQDYIADGLVPAADAVTSYKNLLMRGYDTSQIETIMKALKDSSSFGRQGSLTMGQAIRGATEGLRQENSILVDNAGVTKNVSMMWKDYAASIGTTVGSLTLEMKREAEYQGIMQETRFQMGDAAKLSQTYSGRMAALGTSFKNLRVAIGNSIIPIINQVVPYIKAAIDALVVFFNTVAQIMNALFGTNVSMASVEAEAAAESMNNAADAASGAADAQGDLAKKTKEAGKAAKGALASFDQLNVLQSDSGDSASQQGGGAAGSLPALATGQAGDSEADGGVLNTLQQKVAEFKAKFITFIQPVTDALGRLKESLLPLGTTIWEGLKWAWDNILVPLGEWVITEALPKFLDLLAVAAENLNTALEILKPLGIWLWENFLQPLAEWVGDKIIEALGWLTERMKELGAWMKDHQEVVQALAVVFGLLAIAVLLILSPAAQFIAILIAIGAAIALLWEGAKLLAPMFSAAWEQIKAKWNEAVAFWSAIVNNYIIILKLFWGKVLEFLAPVGQILKDTFGKALEWISSKFTSNFEGIKSTIKGILNFIIDMMNTLFSSSLIGVNGMIKALNSFGSKVPGWTVIPSVQAIQIPRLATGAVIPPNAEFAAILGDQRNGRNLEAPEGLIRQILREEIGSIKGDFSISFDGSLGALVRELRPHITKENIRFGGSLAKGAA